MKANESVQRFFLIVRWLAVASLAALLILYIGDYLSVHRRMAHRTSLDPIESKQIRLMYAVPRKDGKDEFDFGDPQTETCLHSIFPHLGYAPCWYIRRQDQKPIPIGQALPAPAPASARAFSSPPPLLASAY